MHCQWHHCEHLYKEWMCFEQFSHGHIIKLFQRTWNLFLCVCVSFFQSQNLKVEEVALWGLSGDMSGLEISGGANDPELGRPAPWEMKALGVRRVSQVRLLRTALCLCLSLALPFSLTWNSYNCLCCQRRFNINGFFKLRGQQGDIEPE